MSKKLKIGKTEVVIYPEKEHTYVIPKDISGMHFNQQFSSSFLPRELTAVCIGREEIKGVLHDKYILKEIPKELEELWLKGEPGYTNLSMVLDSVAGIFRGKAKDGRKIKYARSVKVEDINKIFNIIADFEGHKVYQVGIGRNINNLEGFGVSGSISDCGLYYGKELEIIRRHIKGEYLCLTKYSYSKGALNAEEYLKNLVFLEKPYYLNSPGVKTNYYFNVLFGSGAVYDGLVCRGDRWLFNSNGIYEEFYHFGVRPVFYLESDIQNEILEGQEEKKRAIANAQKYIAEKREKIKILEKNIEKQQKELKKEKEELRIKTNEVRELL